MFLSLFLQASSCSFTLPEKLNFKYASSDKSIDLSQATQFLLLARGSLSSGKTLSYHNDQRIHTAQAVDFAAIEALEIKPENWMVQVHAILMTLAWMASAASGMLIARYYKATWKSTRPLDKDLWFRLHQLFMGFAVLATLTGIVFSNLVMYVSELLKMLGVPWEIEKHTSFDLDILLSN